MAAIAVVQREHLPDFGRDTVVKRLAIGRRISEYISKSHNARLRYNAYDCFIHLIESNRADFESVWRHRISSQRKSREGQEFLNALRAHAIEKPESQRLALRLLWLLEKIEKDEGERI
jgi:hypothetical protein